LEEHQKELEEVSNPIMQRFYAASGGAGAPGGAAPGGFPGAGGAAGAGPTSRRSRRSTKQAVTLAL
jgi:L1 cell adhesion molecule like protein